jgi:hypothetical protein
MSVHRHLAVVVRDRHVKPERHPADCVDDGEREEVSCYRLHCCPPFALSAPESAGCPNTPALIIIAVSDACHGVVGPMHPCYKSPAVSAGQDALAISRNRNFWILPVEVFGISAKTTAFGTLKRASSDRQ